MPLLALHHKSMAALTQVLHQSHNARNANCHLCGKGERNGAQRRTKVNFGRAKHWSSAVGKKARLGTKQH